MRVMPMILFRRQGSAGLLKSQSYKRSGSHQYDHDDGILGTLLLGTRLSKP